MSIQNSRTLLRNGGMGMSATTVEDARGIARALVNQERVSAGSLERARASVARKLGVGQGTFENLVRGRLKKLDAALRDRLQAVVVHQLQSEIARLQHDLDNARQIGLRADCEQVVEVSTYLEKARSILRGV